MSPDTIRHSRFEAYVHAFMIGLLILSAANAIFVVTKWIPYVIRSQALAD